MSTRILFFIYWLIITSNAESILTPWYGKNDGYFNYEALDQGRINYIAIAYDSNEPTKNHIQIRDWDSDSRTVNIDQFGTSQNSRPCINVSISSKDYITGYSIWNDSNDRIIGIEFLARNGLVFTCYHPTNKNDTKISVNYNYDIDNFYYLSGWHIHSGAIIDKLRLQFTSAISIPNTDENILANTDSFEEVTNDRDHSNHTIYYILGMLFGITCVLPILGTLIWSMLQKSKKFANEKNMEAVITKASLSKANVIQIQYSKDEHPEILDSQKHVVGDGKSDGGDIIPSLPIDTRLDDRQGMMR